MGRDHHITYNFKLACLSCRKSWRKGIYATMPRSVPSKPRTELLVCPQCRGPLVSMGADFKAPAQSNFRQWRKVELLVKAGILFHVRRFTQEEGDMAGPGPRPYSLREVEPFIEEQQILRGAKTRSRSEGES